MDVSPSRQVRVRNHVRPLAALLVAASLLLSCDAPQPLDPGGGSNSAPTVAVTSPADGALLPLQGAVTVAATANDPDGTIASVEFLDGATSLGTDRSAPYSISWTPTTAGSHQLSARATDDQGSSTTSSAIGVSVENAAPTVSLTSPAPGASFALDAAVVIAAQAQDADGSVTEVRFLDGATLLGIDSTAPFSATWSASGTGSHTLTAVARDNAGGQATSSPVTITVANAAPAVTLTAPAAGAALALNAAATLTATATDADGSVTLVEFYEGATLIGSDPSSPYSASWTPTASGSYSLTARATDNLGTSTTSVAVAVTVVNGGPSVSLTAPANGASLPLRIPVGLTAIASDADGAVAFVRFFDGTTLLATDSSAPYAASWTPQAGGGHSLTARATDDLGVESVSAAVGVFVTSIAPTVSITAPAAGASLPLNSPTTVSAIASDADGAVTVVAFFDGASQVGADSSAPYSISWTPVTPGAHQLTARATDNSALSTTSSVVNLTVNNAAPTVALTAPANGATLATGTPVTLTASAGDVDGTVVEVRFLDGATLVGVDSAAPFAVSWTPLLAGSHSLAARATDNLGGVATSSTVTVTVSNTAPSVAITTPASGAVLARNVTVNVTASASDPDGAVSEVRFFDGATSIGVDSTTPFTISWTPTTPGPHNLTARATDNLGIQTTSAIIAVTVPNSPPATAITAPSAGASLPLGAPVTVSATASDVDGTVAEVRFLDGATVIGIDSTAPYSISWTPVQPGAHTLVSRATDDLGSVTNSAGVGVSVTNAAPTISLTSPVNGTVLLLGVPAGLTASASDADGQVVEVRFFDGATLIAVDSTAPYSISWTAAVAGSRTLTARATDNLGAQTTSTGSSVRVNAPPTVSLTTPAPGTNLTLGQPVTLTATAADGDGTISQVRFFDGPTQVGSDNTAPYTVDWTPTVAGGHGLTARAADNDGAEVVSAVVNVSASAQANTKPVATILSPTPTQTYQGGEVLQLTGQGIDAEDGTLPSARLTWWADFHHDTHTHPFLADTTIDALQVTIPTSGETSANVWYRIYLRVVDAQGVADTVFRDVQPVKINLTVASQRPGLEITLDGQPHTAPYTVQAVAGMTRSLGATSPQVLGDTTYSFASWSDAGAIVHSIATPATNTTYTASFTGTGPANVAPTVTVTAPTAGATHPVNTVWTVSASASDTDGTVAHVDFYDGATLLGSDQTSPYSISWTPTVTGAHSLTARATDNDSATTISSAVGVTITSGSSDVTPPTVNITDPAEGDFSLTGPVTVSANATDNVGVTQVEFQFDGQSLGTDATAPYTATLANTSAYTTGLHVFRARARDAAGNFSAWTTIRVTFGGNNDLPQGFTRTDVATGLTGTGTALGILPDGRVLVCEQGGGLRVVKNGSLLSRRMLIAPTAVNGEQGLLGVTPDPQFSSNRYIYIYYTSSTGGLHNRIARYTVATAGDTVETGSDTVLVDLPSLGANNNHNGGALHFGLDGKLYVAVGERGVATDAPRLDVPFGKLLRFNSDGSIPTDNPFYNVTTGIARSIWVKGLRNPFTFAVSRAGQILINDVGEKDWEEINEGVAGADYGWPTREGPGSGGGFTYPLYAYGHSSNPTLVEGIAIVGAAFYEPDINTFGPGYTGSYFFGDYLEGWVKRLDLTTGEVYAFARLNGSLSDLAVGPDGSLYALASLGASYGVIRISR